MTLRMLTTDRPLGSLVIGRAWRVRPAAGCVCAGLAVASGFLAPAAGAYTAYVSNVTEQTLSPINTVTDTVGSTIAVKNPPFLAITPDGSTAWVTDTTQNTVTPIALTTGTPGTPISVGSSPFAIAITPDGTKAYVADHGSESVTPINLTTKTAGSPIKVGKEPYAIAITPDGSKVYVTNYGSSSVTPITVASNTAGTPITVGAGPKSIAINPEGTTAWVADFTANTITPITLSTNTAGATITVKEPNSLAITPEGSAAYVTNDGQNTVTPVNLLTKTAGSAIKVGSAPFQVAISPDGGTAYVTNYESDSVTPINTTTKTAGAEIKVGEGPDGIAITPDQAPVASFTATPEPAGSPSSFNASASSVAYGTIVSYAWKFGDGATASTSTPTTTHTYSAEGTYTATLTETDSAGTSTTQVFTGQTVSRNGGSNAQTTRSVTVPPPAPVNSTPPSITGIAQQNQALTEVHGTWTNSPTGYGYQWLRCNSAGEACGAISGATGQTYTLLAEDVGHRLQVQETASNAGGSSAPAVSAATAVILPAVPANITLPSITGTMQQGQTPTEVHGTWTNSPTGYGYQWLRCDSAGESCASISGATSQTYAVVAEDVGHRLRVQETASNAGGSSPPSVSAATAAVLPAVPVSITLPSITGTMQQGQTLTEVQGTWTNSPTGYSYQWLRCNSAGEVCSAISGATGETYTLLAEDVNHRLAVRETASNAGGASAPEASPVTAMVDTLPEKTQSLFTYVPLGLQPVQTDPPPRPAAPVISIRSLTVNRHGLGVIPLRCPASATGGCRGTIMITIHIIQPHARRASVARCARGCRPLASANYEARAGQKVRVRVHIASFGRRLLSEHSSVRVSLTATSVADGRMVTATRAIAMKA